MFMYEAVEIVESIPTKIRYRGIIWVPMGSQEAADDKKKKHSKHPVKQPYFLKWLDTIPSGESFNLNDFYSMYPKIKKHGSSRRRLVLIISNLIRDNKIVQVENNVFRKL